MKCIKLILVIFFGGTILGWISYFYLDKILLLITNISDFTSHASFKNKVIASIASIAFMLVIGKIFKSKKPGKLYSSFWYSFKTYKHWTDFLKFPSAPALLLIFVVYSFAMSFIELLSFYVFLNEPYLQSSFFRVETGTSVVVGAVSLIFPIILFIAEYGKENEPGVYLSSSEVLLYHSWAFPITIVLSLNLIFISVSENFNFVIMLSVTSVLLTLFLIFRILDVVLNSETRESVSNELLNAKTKKAFDDDLRSKENLIKQKSEFETPELNLYFGSIPPREVIGILDYDKYAAYDVAPEEDSLVVDVDKEKLKQIASDLIVQFVSVDGHSDFNNPHTSSQKNFVILIQKSLGDYGSSGSSALAVLYIKKSLVSRIEVRQIVERLLGCFRLSPGRPVNADELEILIGKSFEDLVIMAAESRGHTIDKIKKTILELYRFSIGEYRKYNKQLEALGDLSSYYSFNQQNPFDLIGRSLRESSGMIIDLSFQNTVILEKVVDIYETLISESILQADKNFFSRILSDLFDLSSSLIHSENKLKSDFGIRVYSRTASHVYTFSLRFLRRRKFEESIDMAPIFVSAVSRFLINHWNYYRASRFEEVLKRTYKVFERKSYQNEEFVEAEEMLKIYIAASMLKVYRKEKTDKSLALLEESIRNLNDLEFEQILSIYSSSAKNILFRTIDWDRFGEEHREGAYYVTFDEYLDSVMALMFLRSEVNDYKIDDTMLIESLKNEGRYTDFNENGQLSKNVSDAYGLWDHEMLQSAGKDFSLEDVNRIIGLFNLIAEKCQLSRDLELVLMPISMVKVKDAKNIFEEEFNKRRVLRNFLKQGPRVSWESLGELTWGVNIFVERRYFVTSEKYSYSSIGQTYGSGLGGSENYLLFSDLFKAVKASNRHFSDIDSFQDAIKIFKENSSSSELICFYVHDVEFSKGLSKDQNFTPSWKLQRDPNLERHPGGLYEYDGVKIYMYQIFGAPKKAEDRGIILLMSKNAASYIQANSNDPNYLEDTGFVFDVNLNPASEEEVNVMFDKKFELLKPYSKLNPESKKQLANLYVALKILEKIEVKVDHPKEILSFTGYKIPVA